MTTGGILRALSPTNKRAPDPLITERNFSLDGNAAFRKPANTGCGAPKGRSDLAEIFHPLGAKLQAGRTDAQRAQTFPDRIAFVVRD
jgi:hypothetical protein